MVKAPKPAPTRRTSTSGTGSLSAIAAGGFADQECFWAKGRKRRSLNECAGRRIAGRIRDVGQSTLYLIYLTHSRVYNTPRQRKLLRVDRHPLLGYCL
jgi:hypothetical protein